MKMGVKKDVIAVVVVATLIMAVQAACPEQCKCSKEIVDCQNSGLENIPWDLPEPSSIKQLLLGGNKITEVIAEIVSYTNLEQLDLSNNQLSYIDDSVFTSLESLQFLNLERNNLRKLNDKTLEGLPHLIQLNMDNNNLDTLENNVFSDLQKLEHLTLIANKIERIEDNAFFGLKALKSLYLNDNKLGSVPSAAFTNCKELESINLNHNRIDTVPSYAFRGLEKLTELSIDNNEILELSEYAFRDGSASYTPKIETLSLRANRLGDFPSGAFASLVNLQSVDLSQNPMQIIKAYAFKNTKTLESAYFNSMPKLTAVENYALSELPVLSVLEMHSNHKLTKIEEDAFKATPNLRKVDLHANALQSLSPNAFDWASLTFLDLRYNNWFCDCHIQWMREALLFSSNSSQFLNNEVKCKKPEYLAARPVVELKSEEFAPCTNGHGSYENETERLREEQFEDRILIAIIAGITGILLVTMVVLMCRYRNRMFNSPVPDTSYQFYTAYRNRIQSRSDIDNDSHVDKDDERVAIATAGVGQERV